MSGKWIDAKAAAEILDVDKRAVERLVAEGLIGVRRLSGVRARYRKDDCLGLAKLSVVPATAPAPAPSNGSPPS